MHPFPHKLQSLYCAIEFYCVYMYYIFIIHSSVVGQLGYCYFLVIVNTKAMDMAKQVSLGYEVLWEHASA